MNSLIAQDSWISYTTENTPMSDHRINDILIVDGIKWIGTNWGLYSFDNTTWLDYSDFLPNKQVQSLSLDNNDVLYVSTLGGIAVFDGSNWEYITPENSLLPSHVNEVLFDNNNTAFIGAIDGLYRLENETISLVLDSSSLEPGFVNVSALAFKGDSLCIGTINGGLAYLYNDSVRWYNANNGLIDNTATDIEIKDESIWISCPYAGLVCHLEDANFLTFNSGFFPNWPSNSLTTLFIDEELIYVGTNEAGFFEFSYVNGIHNTFVYNTQNSDIISNTVFCFDKGDDGFWIGTENGLVNWNKNSVVFEDAIEDAPFLIYDDKIAIDNAQLVEIYSLNGKSIIKSYGKRNIDISRLPKGAYILSKDFQPTLFFVN